MLFQKFSFPIKSNETFDDFIVHKNKCMKNVDNQKQINMSKNENNLLKCLAINFTHETRLSVPINFEDFKIYSEEKNNKNNILKDRYYQFLFNVFEQNPECTLDHAYKVAFMLLGFYPFLFTYSDIKNNYINHLVLK